MGLRSKLNIDDSGNIRAAFNARAQELMTAVRRDHTDKRAYTELASLVTDACDHFMTAHRIPVPRDVDEEDALQEGILLILNIASDPTREIETPYDYFSRTLRNVTANMSRNQKEIAESRMEAGDSEKGGLLSVATEDDPLKPLRVDRHRYERLMTNLREEYEDDLEDLIANNGFTLAEKAMVEKAMDRLIKDKRWEPFREVIHDYYLGDLLQPLFITTWEQKLPPAEGAMLKRRMFDVRNGMHELLERQHQVEYEDSLKAKLEAIEEFRRTNREPLPEPVKERNYITPSDMIRKLGKGYSSELHQKMHGVLLSLLSTRVHEDVTLDDGAKVEAGKMLVGRFSNPRSGGKYTIYIDDQAKGFFERELGIHQKREGWLPLSRFDVHIGRTGWETHRRETFDYLYDLWRHERKVEVDGKKRPARDYIEFCTPIRGHVHEFMQGMELPKAIEGMTMYVSPDLKPFVRQHLLCRPEDEQKQWLRIRGVKDGVQQRLHLSGRGKDGRMGVATYLAVIMILEDLQKRDIIVCGEPPEPKKPAALMGKFMIDGKHSALESNTRDGIWLVSPDLVGEGRPISKEAVMELRSKIMENPQDYPRYTEVITVPNHRE
jgi:hypothetical protein